MTRRAALLALPNMMSIVRLPLAAAVWIVPERPAALLVLMLLAGISDLLDGALARRSERRGRSRDPEHVGTWLDPLCDKAFVLSLAAALWRVYGVAPPLLALLAARELVQLPLVLAYLSQPELRQRLHFDFRASPAGKLTTALQLGAVAAWLYRHPAAPPITLLAGATGLLAAALYLHRAGRAYRHA